MIPRLSDWVIDAVVAHFGGLNHLIEAPLDELAAVPGVGFPRAREIKDGLSRIYESDSAGAQGLMFHVGDTVVYPHHGAGRILEIIEQDFQGAARRYYSIQILHNDMNIKLRWTVVTRPASVRSSPR